MSLLFGIGLISLFVGGDVMFMFTILLIPIVLRTINQDLKMYPDGPSFSNSFVSNNYLK